MRRQSFVHYCLLILVAMPVCLAGCSETAEEPVPGAEPAAAPAQQSAAPAATGTPAPAAAAGGISAITGKVTFEGTPPERAVLETAGDPKCAEMHKTEPLLSEREVVGADGGVQWAFVYVKNPPAGDYALPETEAKLDQTGCRYTPHVLGIRVGQKLSIQNSDPLLHNVRAIARANKPINYGQPANTAPRVKVFDKPENEIRIKCDVHPWMTAFAFVMDHPFFAVTDEHGQFTIPNVPAGDYTVVLWHEAYGEQEATVSVQPGSTAEVAFTAKAAS